MQVHEALKTFGCPVSFELEFLLDYAYTAPNVSDLSSVFE